MAGDTEPDYQETRRDDFSFDWDETTQLYFHASSGFYHDPSAGWFYSSRDGLYYKFENGNYVLLECSDKVNNECEREVFVDNPLQDESFTHVEGNVYENPYSSPPANDSESCHHYGVVVDESNLGYTECSSIQEPENPPAPSDWLEETLINLYLSGSNRAIDTLDDPVIGLKMDINNDNCKPEEGDPITEGHCGLADPDASRDEENWRAQYGQVVHSREEPMPDFHAVDLWGWEVVKGSRKVGKGQEARLVGKLVKRSAKSHPSMPSSCSRFRTAPICEVHLDLVRVRTGQVYKLHNPSTSYLASMSTYDSSNPTKGWNFPELSITMEDSPLIKSSGKGESGSADGDADSKCMTVLPNQLSASKMQASQTYRDRAAERRNLHGGFGVGPGQKSSLFGDDGGSSSQVSTSTEEAAAEALSMSFGVGSYARKILENMGWKEGEALGNTTKGLVEPIKAVGNMGNAGLGWPQGRIKLP
ncbi:D111/G-PATCH DOMAIN-CONTAINING PROTEIN [Salix viminalis]|uniref:D111/G-PATCH DOMAIN-CONTAINING PROTEIN n=1 Tax=Salix viminalis TaxID=40686 RepID=A0A9Q0ZCF8_SALVM|nr:D111/G-PATCH DOMAIN-CONTAINING PROTEIN [Salix viminalis]